MTTGGWERDQMLSDNNLIKFGVKLINKIVSTDCLHKSPLKLCRSFVMCVIVSPVKAKPIPPSSELYPHQEECVLQDSTRKKVDVHKSLEI